MKFRYLRTYVRDETNGLDETFNHLVVIDDINIILLEYFDRKTLKVLSGEDWNNMDIDYDYQLRYDMRTWLDNNIGMCRWVFNSGMMGIQFTSQDDANKFLDFWGFYV